MKIRTKLAALAGLSTVTVGATVAGFSHTAGSHGLAGVPAATAVAAPLADQDPLAASIDAAQAALRTNPQNAATWAALGTAYVEQARATADPSYYPKADGALAKALALKPDQNLDAMIGMGMLANSRHDFARAKDWARRALAYDPASATAVGVLVDADTQLGDYATASTDAQRMIDLRPGIASFTRASYEEEQHGRDPLAREALQRALGDATSPADVAFCHHYLGELAFNEGEPAAALTEYRLAEQSDPGYAPAVAGAAKAEEALSDTVSAERDYAIATARLPLPQYVLEFGELLQAEGKTARAQDEFRLLAAEQDLLAAGGVLDDLTASQVAADHGDPADAVRHAQTEWGRRHSVLVADALAWALHRAGRDAEAVGYARQANGIGWHNALFEYHLGAIEDALGEQEQARTDLTTALKTNPYFSPLQVPEARRELARLGTAGAAA